MVASDLRPAYAQAPSSSRPAARDEVEQRYRTGQTQINPRTLNFLLFDTAEQGCLDLVMEFQTAEASLSARDRFGNTALLIAALMWAAGHSNDVPTSEGLATVTLLLDRGASLDLTDDRGRSALMIAAARGHEEIVAYFLARGADSRKPDKAGKTAFDLAANEAARQAQTRP